MNGGVGQNQPGRPAVGAEGASQEPAAARPGGGDTAAGAIAGQPGAPTPSPAMRPSGSTAQELQRRHSSERSGPKTPKGVAGKVLSLFFLLHINGPCQVARQ